MGALPGCLPTAPHMPGHRLCPLSPLPQLMSCFQIQFQGPPSSPVGLRVSLVSLPLPIGQSWLHWEGHGTWHLSPSL